jgi:hypothetical protein
VEQGSTATLFFNITQLCLPKHYQLDTVTVDYFSKTPKPTDVRKTFCQLLYNDKNTCNSTMSGCECGTSKNIFKVSRDVTDLDGEQWFIKAQTKHNQFVAEKTVLINVTGKYEHF